MTSIITQMFKDNQIFSAPLAGITDKPFRKIIRMFAPNISIVTEMISSHSLVDKHKNCIRNFDTYEDEGNIGTQIFGADCNIMGEAAKILEGAGAKWIDINMGCPVPKVATKAGAGAYLMKDHVLAGRIIESVVKAVKIPVSIKTRLGWDENSKNWQDLVHVAAESGASFVCLHGRTRAQGYTGKAILDEKPELPIPIIANGDIKNLDDIKYIDSLGYDGVMIGRAMLGKPWLFGVLCNKDVQIGNIGNIILQHFDLVLEYYGEKVGVPMFRKHLAWYSSGMLNSSQFRIKINQITDKSKMIDSIKDFWSLD